jgi:hypothetical protein
MFTNIYIYWHHPEFVVWIFKYMYLNVCLQRLCIMVCLNYVQSVWIIDSYLTVFQLQNFFVKLPKLQPLHNRLIRLQIKNYSPIPVLLVLWPYTCISLYLPCIETLMFYRNSVLLRAKKCRSHCHMHGIICSTVLACVPFTIVAKGFQEALIWPLLAEHRITFFMYCFQPGPFVNSGLQHVKQTFKQHVPSNWFIISY